MTDRARTRIISVKIDIPPRVSDADVAEFVTTALECWGGGYDPRDPLFDSLDVHHVTISGCKYENERPEEDQHP